MLSTIPFRAAVAVPSVSQPSPIACMVSHATDTEGPLTVISRAWAPGDAAKCTRCPQCEVDASGTLCQITFFEHVPAEQAREKRFALPLAIDHVLRMGVISGN